MDDAEHRDRGSSAGPLAGLLGVVLRLLRLRQLSCLALEYGQLSAALLSAELAEEARRLTRLALAAAVSLILLFLTILFAELLVLALAWDGPRRLTVALSLAAADVAALLAALLWAWRLARRKGQRFRHSRAEWERNLEKLKRWLC